MSQFDFYQDVKVTVWQRQHFSIEAGTIEEAREIAKRYNNQDISFEDDAEVDEVEWLYDTEEHITPEENGGCATIEVYERQGKYKGNLIADNANPGLSAMSEERKPIGYQIDFKDGEYPEGLFSFQVFRTEEDAKDYLAGCMEEGEVVKVYEGDVEDPAFLPAMIRKFRYNEKVVVNDGISGPYEAIVSIDTTVDCGNELVGVHPLVDGYARDGRGVPARCVYQFAQGKVCCKCGKPVCADHNYNPEGSFWCPACNSCF